MPLKMLADMYFENKVKVIPPGAGSFFNCLAEVERLIHTPGLINLDEADISAVLYGAKKVTLVSLEARGKERIRGILEQLAKITPADEAKKAFGSFFFVTGDEGLCLADVNDIAEGIYGLLNNRAEVIFGASIDEKMKESVKINFLLGH